MFVETAAACISLALTYMRAKEMMPMAQFVNAHVIPAITKAASFAAYAFTLFSTGDASFATALHNLQIED